MISQAQSGRQRRTRQANQFTVPMKQESLRILYAEQADLIRHLHQPISQAIVVMCTDIHLITPDHCNSIDRAFVELRQGIKTCLDTFSGPNLSVKRQPYHLVIKLSALYRMILEAPVLIKSVRGQCQCGRLGTDPTGVYWHLRKHLRDLVVRYRDVIACLNWHQSQFDQQYSEATA